MTVCRIYAVFWTMQRERIYCRCEIRTWRLYGSRACQSNCFGISDPICKDKQATDENFDEAVRFTMDHLDCFEMFMGTHNEESNYKLAKLIDEKGLKRDDPRIFFAQLLGMSDNISFNLAHEGYNVTKYVPYAKVRDVLPYLIRRAEENTSVAGQTSRELRMLKAELDRRKAVRAF